MKKFFILIKTLTQRPPSGTLYFKNSRVTHRPAMRSDIKLTHALKTQGGTVSKRADFPSTNKEHLPLLSVLIETNGCVDTGEKLGVK